MPTNFIFILADDLGYADLDPVVADPALLAAVLPAERVWHVDGSHSWSSWKRLWSQFLDRSSFAARCGG